MAGTKATALLFLAVLMVSEYANTAEAVKYHTRVMGFKASDHLDFQGKKMLAAYQRKQEKNREEATKHFNAMTHTRHAHIMDEFLQEEAKLEDSVDGSVDEVKGPIAGPDATLVQLQRNPGVTAVQSSDHEDRKPATLAIDEDEGLSTFASIKDDDTKGWFLVDLGFIHPRIEFVRLWSDSYCFHNEGYLNLGVSDQPPTLNMRKADAERDSKVFKDPAESFWQASDLSKSEEIKFIDVKVEDSGRFIYLKRDSYYSCSFKLYDIGVFSYEQGLLDNEKEWTNAARQQTPATVEADPGPASGMSADALVDGNRSGLLSEAVFLADSPGPVTLLMDLKFSQEVNELRIWPRTRNMGRGPTSSSDYAPQLTTVSSRELTEKGAVAFDLRQEVEVQLMKSDKSNVGSKKTGSRFAGDGSPLVIDGLAQSEEVRFVEITVKPASGKTVSLAEIEVVSFPNEFPDFGSGKCDGMCKATIGKFLSNEAESHSWWNSLKMQVRKGFNEEMHYNQQSRKWVSHVMLANTFANWETKAAPGRFYGIDHKKWVNGPAVSAMQESSEYREAHKTSMEKIKRKTAQKMATCSGTGCQQSIEFFADCIKFYIQSTHTTKENRFVKASGVRKLAFLDPVEGQRTMQEFIGDAAMNLDLSAIDRDHPDWVAKNLKKVLEEGIKDDSGTLDLETKATALELLKAIDEGLLDELSELIRDISIDMNLSVPDRDGMTTGQMIIHVTNHVHTAESMSHNMIDMHKHIAKMNEPLKFHKVGDKLVTNRANLAGIKSAKHAGRHAHDVAHAHATTGDTVLSVSLVALAGIGLACSVITFIMVMYAEEATTIDKLYAGTSLVISAASLGLIICQHIPSIASAIGANGVSALSTAGTYLGGIGAAISAAYAVYGAVIAFKEDRPTEGTLKLVAAVLLATEAVLGILIAAGCLAATGWGAIASIALLIVACFLLFLSSFFGPKPEPEEPREDDRRVALIRETIRAGYLHPKIRFGAHHYFECDGKYPNTWTPSTITTLLSGHCISPMTLDASDQIPGYRVSGEWVHRPAVNYGMSLCVGNKDMKDLLSYLFSEECVYYSGAGSLPAAHHKVPYWLQIPQRDYNEYKKPEMWSSTWDAGMKDYYERDLKRGKRLISYDCLRGHCYSYCGADWSGGEWCWTGQGGEYKKCTTRSDCEFYLPCVSGCTL